MILAAVLISAFTSFLYQELIYFTPPPDWTSAQLSSGKRGFVAHSTEHTRPSLYLSVERSTLSYSDYLKSVQRIYTSIPKTSWRKIETLLTKAGSGTLTSIDMDTPHGMLRILQLLLQKQDRMIILTASTTQTQFPSYYPLLLETFRSLSYASSVQSSLQDPSKFSLLEQQLQTAPCQQQFARFLQETFPEQGKGWLEEVLLHYTISEK